MGRFPPVGIIGSISDQHKESEDGEACFGATILIKLGNPITEGWGQKVEIPEATSHPVILDP